MLVDNGSSANIIFADTLNKMDLKPKGLRNVTTSLLGFGGGEVRPLGSVYLAVSMGRVPCRVYNSWLLTAPLITRYSRAGPESILSKQSLQLCIWRWSCQHPLGPEDVTVRPKRRIPPRSRSQSRNQEALLSDYLGRKCWGLSSHTWSAHRANTDDDTLKYWYHQTIV